MRMNEFEIDEALNIIGQHAPEFLPYAKFLSDWRDIINQNSDGWAYWKAGTRPARNLEDGIQRIVDSVRGRGTSVPSTRDLDRALTPIKSFATRHKLPVPTLGAPVGKSSSPSGDDIDPVRREKIMDLAAESPLLRDGQLELDPSAKISEGDDNGAYVQTWMWVPFSGTELDKEGR